MTPITYCSTDVNGLKVFYRESGPTGAPKLLLLHGYPSASHMFRDLIPQLADRFHAYEEGLSDGWNPIRAYWKEPTPANRDAIRSMVQPETTVWQYTHGVADPSLVSPDGYTRDNHYLARPGADEIQLDLFLDYASNIDLYPRFQDYFRTREPPLLAIWGRNDPFFLPAGAEAFKRDIPAADVRLLDTGHFALETHAGEIATAIRGFLAVTARGDV